MNIKSEKNETGIMFHLISSCSSQQLSVSIVNCTVALFSSTVSWKSLYGIKKSLRNSCRFQNRCQRCGVLSYRSNCSFFFTFALISSRNKLKRHLMRLVDHFRQLSRLKQKKKKNLSSFISYRTFLKDNNKKKVLLFSGIKIKKRNFFFNHF